MTVGPAALGAALEGRYRLLDIIGQGGMATVYRAHDVKHDRVVALKVLHDDLAASLGPERFKREILIAARLQHPHILSVIDSGESAGRLWFTMPFVEGQTLRERLRREGKLSVEAALTIVREAAQALGYAHKQGVIHRDIKPENILLSDDGFTLVADFGIARAVGDRSFEGGLTQTGSAIGTPTYMAPEQATGETVLDERVDQYALAAVLYEMLTGAPPFTGANAAALIAARYTTSVTPMRTTRPEIPADVDSAVQRALSLKPTGRFSTITEFSRAVAPTVSTPPQFDTQPRPLARTPKGRTWAVGLVGAVVVLAIAGAALWKRSNGASTAEAPIRIAVLPLQNLGDSADAYFADGMSDELRAKLVGVPGMQVIARASSVQYAGTTKTPREIAEELGVQYLLTGTLRYQRTADGANAVQIRPELVEVKGEGAATTRWQAAFDEPLTNAPALQSKIAEQVAVQLRVALGAADRTRLAKVPTDNPAAYDAYLRGLSNTSVAPEARRRRVADLERAVSLDPNFALAWTELTRARAQLWASSGTADAELAQKAKEAAERARALAPGEMADYMAWMWYHRLVTDNLPEIERNLRAALRLEPGHPANLSRLARALEDQGRLEEARPLLQQATQLDPLNANVWANAGTSALLQRRYAEARTALSRAMAIQPNSEVQVHSAVMMYAGMGDLDAARATLREAYRHMSPETIDVYNSTYNDFGWILDSAAQERVLNAPLSAFQGDAGQQQISRAQIYHARGDLERSRAAAVKALPGLAVNAASTPKDPQYLFIQGFAAALAGRREESERFIRAGQALERDRKASVSEAGYYHELRARIHTLNGNYDQAFDEIEAALAKPGFTGRGNLALDPMWAPLRSLPRYQKIMTTVSPTELR